LQNAGFNDKNGREIHAENKSLHLHLPHKRMPQVDVCPPLSLQVTTRKYW
jgi:hypothetical protein